MIDIQTQFLNNEIWILTFAGGFQRANVYAEGANEKSRSDFRAALRNEIEKIVELHYKKVPVQPKEHLAHINSILEFTKMYGQKVPGLLNPKNEEALNFGIAQKVFNLYLKYLWCLGKIPTPPHFPIDRIIQQNLGKKESEIISWTKDLTEEMYKKLMDYASTKLNEHQVESLAELELILFERRETVS